jgi:hypothetical protein
MNHNKMAIMVSEFVDGRLSANEEQIVQQHLKECAACRDMHHNFQMLQNADMVEAPSSVRPFFTQRVLKEYDNRTADKIWQLFDFIPRPIITTGLALSLILIGIFSTPLLYQPQNTLETEFALLFNADAEVITVTDDEALAIALSADSMLSNGE